MKEAAIGNEDYENKKITFNYCLEEVKIIMFLEASTPESVYKLGS